MLCGIEWWAYTSKKNAYRICKLCNAKVSKSYNSKREIIIDDTPNTWIKEGKYRGWIIQLKKQAEGYKLTVRGSLHKFFHTHNKGKFTGQEVLASIQGMLDLFEINPTAATIQNIEVGINLPFHQPVYIYLNSNLLYHKKKERREFEQKGIGFSFLHEDYVIKTYEKDRYILRVEVKYKTKGKLNQFGISNVENLQQTSINLLADSVVTEWKEVIVRGGLNLVDEKLNPNSLTADERKRILEFTSLSYQQSYKEELNKARAANDKQRSDALRKKANRLSRFCIRVIDRKGDNIKREIQSMIERGIEEFKKSWSN